MKGKVIKKTDYLGFIEYDIDRRIEFLKDSATQNVEVGDIVEFKIVPRKAANTDQIIRQAQIIKVLSKQKAVDKRLFRLSKAARELNVGISAIVNVLLNNGFDIDSNPNTKITEEQYQTLKRHFSTTQKPKKKPKLSGLKRGTVIETKIKKIIPPSLIVLNFTNDYHAYLQLNNLAWNLARAEKAISTLKVDDTIQVVILNKDEIGVSVSRKHLIPKPSESKDWQNSKIGESIVGTVQEILATSLIIKTSNDFYGKVTIPKEKIQEFELGGSYKFFIQGKNEELYFLDLSLNIEELVEEVPIEKEDFQTQDEDLISFRRFKKSTYYGVANPDVQKRIQKLYDADDKLFSSAITLNKTLYLRFVFNSNAWENDFKKSLLPYLESEDIKTEKEALIFLGNQKYWIRVNTWIYDNKPQNNWVLFNEKIYLAGTAFNETDECDFLITRLAIERTNQKSSKSKESNLAKGTFLLNSPVKIISPFDFKPTGLKQKETFLQLQNKTEAFEVLNKLKKETGAILRDEGLSITIFDKFLEYQESIERKGNKNKRIRIEEFIQIPGDKTDFAIEINHNIEDLLIGSELDSHLITIRTEEISHKESKEIEFVYFSDAIVEPINDKTRFHILQSDILIDQLKKGFYIENKVSIRQYQVQREVIKDFLDKRLKLDHIESMLLRPDKIQAPELVNVDYINEVFTETEEKQPNNNQIKAVKKAIGNKNIFLIQGPPGTGKTTVISEIVEQLINKGEKVLVTSQTHIAVDNVLEKVSNNTQLSCVRIGSQNRIKENLQQYQIDNLVNAYTEDFEKLIEVNIKLINYIKDNFENDKPDALIEALKEIVKKESGSYNIGFKDILSNKSYEFIQVLSSTNYLLFDDLLALQIEWKKDIKHEKEVLIKPLLYKSIDAVFATCIGVRTDKELNDYDLKFDTVIIDEAGKANISESLAPISMGRKIILVGDQKQLPPYFDGSLLDEEEQGSFPNSKYGSSFIKSDIEHALKTSFFEFLVNRIKQNNFPKENIELLNYQHRMHPHIGEFISESFYDGQVKMGEQTVKNRLPLDSPFDKEIVFVNTATAQNPFESFDGFSARNDAEASCISSIIVPKLLKSGLKPSEFAIVSPYKSQVFHLRNHLRKVQAASAIDVSTLDSFQGMEFDVIVFSFTRSAKPDQANRKVGFLDDARRLNVAFSRARKKLILVGNANTLIDKRSHFDSLFDYTGLFTRLIQLSKKESIGNFVNLTDFKDLKTTFQINISKFKQGNKYPCKLKLTFEKTDYLGHIFTLDGGLDGLFWDGKKEYEYEKGVEYFMYITAINFDKESLFLSPTPKGSNHSHASRRVGKPGGLNDQSVQLKKLKFFTSKIEGDIVNVKYKKSIDIGHFFEIEEGFDGLLYDPQKKHDQFVEGNAYDLEIFKLDRKKGQISFSMSRKR